MAALTYLHPCSRPSPPLSHRFRSPASCGLRHPLNPRRKLPLAIASSVSSGDLNSNERRLSGSSRKKSVLLNLVHDIEPFDTTLLQKDVPATTLEAMKRTISGMLGLLPSVHFQVMIEAFWEPLSKLLVYSMMTGYTLRNAEFRLWLERNLDIYDKDIEKHKPEDTKHDLQESVQDSDELTVITGNNEWSSELIKIPANLCVGASIQGLGEVTPEAQQYILELQLHLSSIKQELFEVKRRNAALEMQQFVGEERNDLLDYLRMLRPEKVVELSDPTSPELKETIQSVVHGLLATLSPKMRSKESSNANGGIGNGDVGVENSPLQFQPLVSFTRDYLARLLFWCMLLGHHLRGLEYRMELAELMDEGGGTEQAA